MTPDQMTQEPEQPRGLLGNLFGNPDTMANLALAFNSMRLNPDPNLAAVLSSQMKERRAERQQKAELNKTVEMLRKIGADSSLIELAQAGYAKEAIAQAYAKPKDDRTAGMQNYDRYLEIYKTQGPEAAKEFLGVVKGGTTVNVGGDGLKLTPFQKKLDEDFAGKMVDWQSTGAVDASRQVAQISSVMKQFEAGKPLTGPVFAGLDKIGLSSIFMPDAKQAKDTVEQVVQRSLRETLGGQFAEREGERLIQRAYNPALPPEANLARLKGLYETLTYADQVKREMIKYATENGTIVGYEGPKMPSASEIEAAMDSAYAPEAKSQPAAGAKVPDFSAMSDAELDAYINEMGKR